MRARLLIVALLGLTATCALTACDGNNLSLFGSPTQTVGQGKPTPTPTATPSPSPSPSTSPKAESCAIDYMTLRPIAGLILQVGVDNTTLDLTPYQTVKNDDGTVAQREVSKACNDPRATSVVWVSSSAAVQVGAGFNPSLRRVGIGESIVYAQLEGHVSNRITVR